MSIIVAVALFLGVSNLQAQTWKNLHASVQERVQKLYA